MFEKNAETNRQELVLSSGQCPDFVQKRAIRCRRGASSGRHPALHFHTMALFCKPALVHEVVLDVVSRLSGRIFVGERLGRDDAWLHTVINYVETSVFAMQDMRMWPEFLRPIVAWFLPRTRLLRQYIKDAVIRNLEGAKGRTRDMTLAEDEDLFAAGVDSVKAISIRSALQKVVICAMTGNRPRPSADGLCFSSFGDREPF